MGGWYNGFKWSEREKGGAGIRKLLKEQSIPPYTGPCMLCGDPESPVDIHAEDYAEPYYSGPPGFYWLCRHCHFNKVHARFNNPDLWHAFRAHVRRGGYARDLKDPIVRKEFMAYRAALKRGKPAQLRQLRDRKLAPVEWWDELGMDARIAQPGYPKPVRRSGATA